MDDPLEKYLPSGKVQSRFTDPSPVTFRQVVAHVAGLPRDDSGERVYKGNVVIFPSGEEIQANLKEMELIVAPMTKIQYSNLGFALLGLALEQIAGQSYTRYVTEQILHPLAGSHGILALLCAARVQQVDWMIKESRYPLGKRRDAWLTRSHRMSRSRLSARSLNGRNSTCTTCP